MTSLRDKERVPQPPVGGSLPLLVHIHDGVLSPRSDQLQTSANSFDAGEGYLLLIHADNGSTLSTDSFYEADLCEVSLDCPVTTGPYLMLAINPRI
jgi:hypothetical protein